MESFIYSYGYSRSGSRRRQSVLAHSEALSRQAVVGHWMTVTEWQKNVLFINVNNSCGSTCGCVWALLSLSRSI